MAGARRCVHATHTTVAEIDKVVYPFLSYDQETKLFERNLAKERDFLDDADVNDTSDELRQARSRIPSGRRPVPGLADPNERNDKGLLKSIAYRVLASEGVVSRNIAKRGSERWGRDAAAFHFRWQQELESALDRARDGRQAETRRASLESCRECLLHERVRRGARGDD